ncbi:MAG: UbiD family decarboxylase [Planctomycetota bacterium]
MPHEFLSDFVSRLQDAGELVRISAPVDTGLEVAAITDRVCKSPDGGPALLFEKPKNSSIPVITNLLGSRRRLCLALGIDSLDQLTDRLGRQLRSESGGWLEALKLAPSTSGLSKFAPRTIKTAVCQQVVKLGRDVSLWDLPIPRHWPDEANPVITAAHIVTQDQETGARSVERIPIQVVGQNQVVPHWNRYHAAFRHWQSAVRLQRQFPVGIALGGDPIQMLMSAGSLVAPSDSLLLGGFLRGSGLDLVKARTIELEVPAASEIVIEGYIDYAEQPVEAPSIAGTAGHYLPAEPLPVIQVTAITHRANPLLPAIVPGPPPSEESWIGLAVERLSLAAVKAIIPEIVDLHHPFAGAGQNLLFVSIRKEHPLQAPQVLNGLWGSRLVGLNKMIVIVDADVNVQREADVWFAVGSYANPERDVISVDGPTFMDDPSTDIRGVGRKLGIDATRKFSEETRHRGSPRPLAMPAELLTQLNGRWNEFGLREE